MCLHLCLFVCVLCSVCMCFRVCVGMYVCVCTVLMCICICIGVFVCAGICASVSVCLCGCIVYTCVFVCCICVCVCVSAVGGQKKGKTRLDEEGVGDQIIHQSHAFLSLECRSLRFPTLEEELIDPQAFPLFISRASPLLSNLLRWDFYSIFTFGGGFPR